MKRIFLLGGYGGFGSRLAKRLVSAGYEVVVAGRSASKAEAFCRGQPNMRPLQTDIATGIGPVLERERPFAVVDAAGPFQNADYSVPRAAIAAGCHYLDIADAREFVCGIGALDDAAKNAGVTVIAGASSDPALTGAVVRALSENLSAVCAVDIALSVSSRAACGTSATRAILTYAGKPVRLWRGGRWTRAGGWQELTHVTFKAGYRAPLRRTVAIIDVPSLELLPDRLPGRPAVTFRAGTESGVHNRALWLLTPLVRASLLRSLEPLHALFRPIQALRARFDSGRSAMTVSLFGLAEGRRVERSWTLLADNDHGREIPCLAVPPLLAKIEQGRIGAGARDADGLLDLDAFGADLDALDVSHEMQERALSDPLYAQIMGDGFAGLPAAVRDMHCALRDRGAFGRATVTRGQGLLARLIGAVIGFPAAGEHDLHVHFEEEEGRERWARSFSNHRFHSAFSRHRSLIVERFGPIRFGFELGCIDGELRMRMRRWWCGPLPLPLILAPRSPAREWEEQGRFHFDVPVTLPFAGPLIHYRGWLVPATE